jgi:hypothetical protein
VRPSTVARQSPPRTTPWTRATPPPAARSRDWPTWSAPRACPHQPQGECQPPRGRCPIAAAPSGDLGRTIGDWSQQKVLLGEQRNVVGDPSAVGRNCAQRPLCPASVSWRRGTPGGWPAWRTTHCTPVTTPRLPGLTRIQRCAASAVRSVGCLRSTCTATNFPTRNRADLPRRDHLRALGERRPAVRAGGGLCRRPAGTAGRSRCHGS